MVAPYEVGDPVWSYVRVPTKDQAARALRWDLSRSSSFVAAAAPAQQPQSQSQAQAQPQSQAQAQPMVVLQCSAGTNSKPRQEQTTTPAPLPPASQQPPPQQQGAATPCEPKRPREEEEEQQGEQGTPQPVLKVARTAESTGADSNSTIQPQQGLEREKEVQLLRQRCQLLHQQNEDLKRRLGLFHGLFLDKQRLNSFVRHLDTLVK